MKMTKKKEFLFLLCLLIGFSFLSIPYYRNIFVLLCFKHTSIYGTIINKKVESERDGDYYNYTLQYFVNGQEIKAEMLRSFSFKSSKREVGEKVKVIASNRYPKIHFVVDKIELLEYLFVIVLFLIFFLRLLQLFKQGFLSAPRSCGFTFGATSWCNPHAN